MPAPAASSLPPPHDLDLDVHGTIPPGLSGRLVAIDSDGVFRSVELRGGRASYRLRRFHIGAVVHNLVAFGGSILAFGDDSPAYELSAQVDAMSRVDLAGRGRAVAAHPKCDQLTGDLHLIARDLDGSQAHVVVSAGALTRRSRTIFEAPSRIKDLVLTRDRVALVADGSVGVAERDGEPRTRWIATGVDAPHPVHGHDEGDAVVLLVLTPSLERWTLNPRTRSIQREILDRTPRRFAHCDTEDLDGAPHMVWSSGGGTVGRHDLTASSHVHHSLRPHLAGDLVIVSDETSAAISVTGWLVGFVHHTSASTTELRVIDTTAVTGPPIAAVPMPRPIPHDLRCTWIPAAAMTDTTVINKGERTMNTMHHTESSIELGSEAVGTDGDPAVVPDEPRRGPVWRVVGGSLAAGLVGAIVLTLFALAGAVEHVITGSALLAFAAGWAILAGLSNRLTTQPQRWAVVPAAFMAAVGLTLLVAQPDDQALNAAGWIWPPVMLALSVWMVIQVRRSLSGRVRWLIYPVVASLAVVSAGGMYATAGRVHDQQAYPAPGVLYEVGGHRLHLNCTGSGSPTVVLENGLGATSTMWTRVTAALSPTTRVCAYDRAGQGWSDDVSAPQDGVAIAADLHNLLASSGEPGPYVLVGHSAGGAYVLTYAAQYPDEVVGMVLLDSMSPDSFTELPGFSAEQAMMRRGLGVLPSLARLGVGQVLPTSAWSSLPEPEASQFQAFASSPRNMRSMRDEQSMYREVFEQARTLDSLDDKPLVVVTATESLEEIKGWAGAQDRLAALSTNSQHRVADATHEGLVDDSVAFQPSVTAISDVLHAVRTDKPVVAG